MWEHHDILHQVKVINGEKAPDLVIQNGEYLHSIYKKWMYGNIWVLGDRIVYAGQAMPKNLEGTEIVDARGKKIVPGYIEPHVHPFQLYNPQTFAEYAAHGGTTTFISDNLILFLSMENEQAFSILDQLQTLPFSFYWWTRFDSQTMLQNESELFNPEAISEWLARPDVLLGGELTAWPRLVGGDPNLFNSIQLAKKQSKKIEGHLPGASEFTLSRLKLFGVDSDHEAMTVEDVEARLQHGLAVTLRHSSIRPDLPSLFKGIIEKQLDVFDHLMMTTDGSTPGFHTDGVMDKCIRVALEAGVAPIDAYQMATYNIARYYNMTDVHGLIATGRFATFNLLENEQNPIPTDVLSKGVWLKRDGQKVALLPSIDWSPVPAFQPDFDLNKYDFSFPETIGIEMVNDVITKPYEINIDTTVAKLSDSHDESFLMLLDRNGKWRVNTILKGFATNVQGLATSYSNTGDIILIGKDKTEMHCAFNEIRKIGGGMVLFEDGKCVSSVPLPVGGGLSTEPVEYLIKQEIAFKNALADRGYPFADAVYTFLFLQSTHLPYIRVTQIGLVDVLKNKILIPAIDRMERV